MGYKVFGGRRRKTIQEARLRFRNRRIARTAAAASRAGHSRDDQGAGNTQATPSLPPSPKADDRADEANEAADTRSPLLPPADNSAESRARSQNESKSGKMAAPTKVHRVFEIDREDPDTWCSLGLITNTECHQSVLTPECGIRSFCDLDAEEQRWLIERVGTDDIDTACLHHRTFYRYVELQKKGCFAPLVKHENRSSGDLVVVTTALAKAASDVVKLEEGQRLCRACIHLIKTKQESNTEHRVVKRESFTTVLASREHRERSKKIEDLVSRCSVGLMTRTPCHLTNMTSSVAIRTMASLPSRLAYMLVQRVGRDFDTICLHHERLYLGGYGAPCYDPENKHNEMVFARLWLVPRQFALSCRGNRAGLKPGRVICIYCLDSIRSVYTDIDAFYQKDQEETRARLRGKDHYLEVEEEEEDKDASSPKSPDDASSHKEDPESSSAKEESAAEEKKYDSIGRKRRRGGITTIERQLRNLRVDNPEFSEFLGTMDLQSQNREKRRVTKKIKHFVPSKGRNSSRHYTTRGIHIGTNKDVCDCMDLECPGCHFPCPKCGSAKCGDECRCSRNYVYEQMELEGLNLVVHNPLLDQ